MNAIAQKSSTGSIVIGVLVVALIVLHQDNWFWEDSSLIFGIMPVTLFYHIGISIAAACVWFLATKIAWPVDTIEEAKAIADDSRASEEAK